MDAIELCNQALVNGLGADKIEALTEDSTEAISASTAYEPALRYCFSAHPWRFATRTVQLTRLPDAPEDPFEAAYSLPPQLARVIAVRVNDANIEFDRTTDGIVCDAAVTDLVTLEGVFILDPDFWPGYFEAFVVAHLVTMLAKPITGLDPTQAVLRAEGMALTNAKTADSQGRTQSRMPLGRLSALVGRARY